MGRSLPVMFVVVFLIGCGQPPQTQTKDESFSQRLKIQSLEADIKTLKKDVASVRADLSLEKLRATAYRTATFDPAADEGFSRLDSSVGTFTVSVEDVKPFADGVRVTLQIGNLTAATVTAATLKVKWAKREPDVNDEHFADKWDEWQRNVHEKEIKLTQKLQSGRWNRVVLTLPGTPPQEFGVLGVVHGDASDQSPCTAVAPSHNFSLQPTRGRTLARR